MTGHDHDEHGHDHHGHDHGHHGHSHAPKDFGAAFALGAALNAGFVIFETILGFASHSVALLSDAGHNLSDVLALLMAWGASCLGKIPPAGKHTYGYRRSSILVALVNAIVLLVVTGAIALEAIERLFHPHPVQGLTITWVAAIGIAVNLFTALLFASGSKDDLNARGAYLHMAADAAIAFGVVVAGVSIWWTGQLWIDPAISLVIGGVIVAGTWRLLCDSCNLALDAVPEGIDMAAVENHLRSYPEIIDVHHLHIWAMSTTEVALTVHLVKTDGVLDNALLQRIQSELKEEFRIEHTTIQLECGLSASKPCEKADC
ncbi:MAG TPA: cation diffusion facilitator family transporter [Candidatus Methylacidiphilales bacterium]|jgi:cobalt-zinc-cadmium efflux system protein|nr:cation diffusion facilitator family transporter [Candidatus Methylacidiphilales bacterium]